MSNYYIPCHRSIARDAGSIPVQAPTIVKPATVRKRTQAIGLMDIHH
jgi:hypothetical protein